MGIMDIFGTMDKQTLSWLLDAIETAPNIESLDGVRVTVEWFYDMDKDFETFEYLMGRINNKSKLL